MLVGIRPGDPAYEDHQGPNFVPQDDNGNENVPYYDMTAVGDSISFDLSTYMDGLDNPVGTFHANWGETEFLLRDQNNVETFINELSGFDTDMFLVELDGVSGRITLEITDDGAADGTQAAWVPYVGLANAQV